MSEPNVWAPEEEVSNPDSWQISESARGGKAFHAEGTTCAKARSD